MVAWSRLRGSAAPTECMRAMAGGRAIVPCWQADEFETLRGLMDAALTPTETFFDFGNEPGLYFLLERRPPVRFPCAPAYETEAAQREVIAALDRERPPVAILASGAWPDTFDGIATRDRAPLVAAYLDEHYEYAEHVGPRMLARRRPPSMREERLSSSRMHETAVERRRVHHSARIARLDRIPGDPALSAPGRDG